MAIPKSIRDKLLVEAQHRCTICAEKCFEIHHIVEIADGGTDDKDNLIVLCPNCHQHRCHRSHEFTRDQLLLYKKKLYERNEIERRLLLTLGEIKDSIGQEPASDLIHQLHNELKNAAELIDPKRSPLVYDSIVETAKYLAKKNELPEAARKAIEVQYEVDRQKEKAKFPVIEIVKVDKEAWRKSKKFAHAYILELVLNRAPNSDWTNVFNHLFNNSLNTMRRETNIISDRIQMIIADTNNKQRHVDFIKRLIEETNNFVRSQIFPEIDRQIDSAKRQALEEYDTIQKLKSETDDLRI
jgi:hypothetical protein